MRQQLMQRTAFDDSAKYKVRDKRWGFQLKCQKCGFRYSCGGKKSLRQTNLIFDDVRDGHKKHCTGSFDIHHDFHAAEIAHDSAVQTGKIDTTNTTYTDVTDVTIPSTSFTASRKYLILLQYALTSSHGNFTFAWKMLHGSTDFASSEVIQEPDGINTEMFYVGWADVWTAVSSEAIKMQQKSITSNQVSTANASLVVIEISEDLTEGTDWDSDFNSTSTGLTSSWSTSNNASVTITSAANEIWFVMAYSRISSPPVDQQVEARINRDSDTEVAPMVSTEGEDSTEMRLQFLARPYKLSSGSHTFTEQSRVESGTAPSREHSFIFALRLDAFDVHTDDTAYNEAEIACDTNNSFVTSPVEAMTTTIQPTVTGDVLVFGYGVCEELSYSNAMKARLQTDNSDTVATQTADNYDMTSWDLTDERQWTMGEMKNLDTTSHTIDIDITSDSATKKMEDRCIVAFTMELAGAAPAARTLYSGPIPQPIGMI